MRKSIFAIFTVAVAVAAALLLTGCERAIDMAGRPVSFAAGISDGASGPKTRVAYGAEESNYQALDWQEGDHITIYCEACEDKKIAMYEVQDVKKASDADMHSYAGLKNAESDGAGLRWGTGEHTFYAVYPSPEEDRSITIGIGPYSDGGTRSSVAKSISNNTVIAAIPSRQKVIGSVTESGGIWTATPDLTNMLMTAKSTYYAETGIPDGSVFLDFKPLTTVLEFTIKKEDSDSVMDISSVSLTSAAHALSGRFKVDMDVNGKYTTTGTWCTEGSGRPETTLASATPSEADRKVTINFGSPVKLAKEQSLTFTFFLNPGNDVDDLTFSISGTVGKESEEKESFYRKTALKKSDGTGVPFPTHKKSVISGLMLPDAIAWTVNYDPTVDPWNASGTDIKPMPEVSIDPFVTSWDTENGIDDELTLEPEPVKWIDLGLPSGTLWADRNLGARSVVDPGDHFAWGETGAYGEAPSPYPTGWTGTQNDTYLGLATKTVYCDANYKYYYGYSYNPYLYPADDPVYAKLELISASTPTEVQWNELIDNCYRTIDATGVRFTSKYNGKSIFIPVNGFYYEESFEIPDENGMRRKDMGHYWTSTINKSGFANRFAFWNNDSQVQIAEYQFAGAMGIRPVKVCTDSPVAVGFVNLGLPSGTLWADVNLGATAKSGLRSLGKYYSYGETNAYHEAPTQYPSAYEGTKNQKYLDLPYKTVYQDNDYYKWYGTGKYSSGVDVLEPEDDAATVALGDGWHTPTITEWQELLDNCTIVEDIVDGIKGRRFTSKVDGYKDQSIFLPYSGLIGGYLQGFNNYNVEGDYWVANAVSATHSYRLRAADYGVNLLGDMDKTYGISVRAVKTAND